MGNFISRDPPFLFFSPCERYDSRGKVEKFLPENVNLGRKKKKRGMSAVLGVKGARKVKESVQGKEACSTASLHYHPSF